MHARVFRGGPAAMRGVSGNRGEARRQRVQFLIENRLRRSPSDADVR